MDNYFSGFLGDTADVSNEEEDASLINLGVVMPTNFRRIKWAKPPATNVENQVTIVLSDGRTFAATKAQIGGANTASQLKAMLTAVLGGLPDVWIHKNRNGRWAISTGTEPAIWPEDEI